MLSSMARDLETSVDPLSLTAILESKELSNFCEEDSFYPANGVLATAMSACAHALDGTAPPGLWQPPAATNMLDPRQIPDPPAPWPASLKQECLLPPPSCAAEVSTGLSAGSPAPRSRKTKGQGWATPKFKTERANKLNKAAQQRYREKKKARMEGLRQEAEVLQQRVAELSNVFNERQALQAKLDEAERRVALLSARAEQDGGDAAPQAQGVKAEPATEGPARLDVVPSEQTLAVVKVAYGSSVDTVRGILQDVGCSQDQVPVLDVSAVPAAAVERIRSAVHSAYASCLEVVRLAPVSDIYGLLIETYGNRATHFNGSIQHWTALVASLGLGPADKARALEMQAKYSRKLEGIFEMRERLHQLGVRVCLPTAESLSRRDSATPSTSSDLSLDAPMPAPPQRSLFSRPSSAHETAAVIRKLQENLVEEQRLLAEIDQAIYMELLHPLQAARCMIGSFPYHCDVLSLVNALGLTAALAQA